MIDPLALQLPQGMVKALSFKQPFAWLIANGFLLVDDRTWGNDYRGPMLIHASKGIYEEYYNYLVEHTDLPLPPRDKMEFGGVVGVANVIGCYRANQLPQGLTHEQRSSYDNLPPNVYGFLFDQAQPLPLMSCRGRLKIFEIDFDALLADPGPAQGDLF